jgi:hypothetical protein
MTTPSADVEQLTILTRNEAHAFADKKHLSILPEYDAEDGWVRCRVAPRQLHNMYGTIGLVDAQKGERFGDISDRLRSDRSAHGTAFASKVFDARANKAVLVYCGPSGRCYVGDGNHRVLNGCVHDDPWIEAILVPVNTDWRP